MPDISIIIPYYNREDTIPFTLASVAKARKNWEVEVILVDDGSPQPADALPSALLAQVDLLLRQENQGLLFARLSGFAKARGEFTLFLDSDDLVGPDKFEAQLSRMITDGLDVSYSDCADVILGTDPDSDIEPVPHVVAEDTEDTSAFFIDVQPAPHSPIFRTSYLRELVEAPLFPPDSRYNPVAEIWFYHIAAPFPAKIGKVSGCHTWVGGHAGPRITGQWEAMAYASLAVGEAFMHACPKTDQGLAARSRVAAKAFHAWRGLPYDFVRDFQQRQLALWRAAPAPQHLPPSGRSLHMLAKLLGWVNAARVLRRIRRRTYESCRSMDDHCLQKVIENYPSPATARS
jgi:hypothetical protein